MEEKVLRKHGYTISPGTLYPILHAMERNGLLQRRDRFVNGKIRKYYTAAEKGMAILIEARKKAYGLFKEIQELRRKLCKKTHPVR